MAPQLWKGDNLKGAQGLGDIRGPSNSEWSRASELKKNEETRSYDMDLFKVTNVSQPTTLRHDRSSGWTIKGELEMKGTITLEASHAGARLDIFEQITMESLDVRKKGFFEALNNVVEAAAKRSDFILPTTGFWSYIKSLYNGDAERLKMRYLVTEAYYAEKRSLYEANRKGATITISGAAAAAGAAPASGGAVSALALLPTATITISSSDVKATTSQGKNLVAYSLKEFECNRSAQGWKLERILRFHLKPSSSQVSVLDGMWS